MGETFRGLTTYHERAQCSAYLGANESRQKHLLDEHHGFTQLRAENFLRPNSFYAMDVCDLHPARLPSDMGM
jgi:hypothetical protein